MKNNFWAKIARLFILTSIIIWGSSISELANEADYPDNLETTNEADYPSSVDNIDIY